MGEYSEVITKIALDVSEDDEEDEGGDGRGGEDGGYWIEGITGEEVRSKWRLQPLHSMAMAALLHPRATNLPPHVQACYMQAAFKLFIRSCLDCKEVELVASIGTLRSRLSVYLQVYIVFCYVVSNVISCCFGGVHAVLILGDVMYGVEVRPKNTTNM